MAYHHAGLSRGARACVEAAFRNRHLKVVSCTPTLAAGVNLPARLVVVRDIYPMGFIRRRPCRVVLSAGELLNMLGCACYPRQELEERPVHRDGTSREGMSCLRRDQ